MANPLSFDYNTGHPSTQGIADDVRYLEVKAAEVVKAGTSSPKLNLAEVQFFKQHGYLIKQGLLADSRQAFKQAIDHFWDSVPGHGLKHDDYTTWLNNPGSHWSEEDHPRVGSLMGTNWKMRSPGESGVGTESFLIKGIANHPNMIAMAKEFLGAPIKPVERVRGIYGVFPVKTERDGALHPHGDYMASQISAMVLLHDVPPRCGGFTFWAGSHKRMHMCWDRVSGSTITGERAPRYASERDQVLRDTVPVEFSGQAGDVVFWHPRLIHSAGVNYSVVDGNPRVRILTPIDYQRAGETYIDDLEFGPGPKYQWWVDTRNVEEDVPATEQNLWHGWAIG